MLKDKISPALKNRFLEEIKKSGESNKERGFLLCLSEKGHIYPTRTCEGTECDITLWKTMVGEGRCTGEVQGEFHTHPVRTTLTGSVKGILGFTPEEESIKKAVIDILQKKHKEEGIDITLQTPSYRDVLNAVLTKCIGFTNGTSCIGTDIEDDRIECWTVKKDISTKDMKDACDKANSEIKEEERERKEDFVPIKRWVKPIFDREVISLK